MATYGSQPLTTNAAANESSPGGLLTELMGGQPSPARLKVPQKDLLMFFRQLAVILQSGVPLAQGMILIAENMTNEKLSHCVNRISARISAGEELSLSLRQYPKVFESLTVVRVGVKRWHHSAFVAGEKAGSNCGRSQF